MRKLSRRTLEACRVQATQNRSALTSLFKMEDPFLRWFGREYIRLQFLRDAILKVACPVLAH